MAFGLLGIVVKALNDVSENLNLNEIYLIAAQ